MTCKEAVGRITDYYEGVLPPSEAQEIQVHLATCDNCHAYFENSRQMTAALGKLPNPAPLSAKAKQELLTAFREQHARKPRFTLTRPWAIGAAAATVAILVAIIWIVWIHTKGTLPPQTYQAYAVDFSNQLLLRGESSAPPVPPAVIPRGRWNLSIQLELGYQPGAYDVSVQRNRKVFASASGTVRIENHKPILHVKIDLSHLPPGQYKFYVRRAGEEWRYFRVVLK
jgi:anti-sigma factor RsiW